MRGRLYGRLDCPAAQRAITRGGYVKNRVFFADETIAVSAGFRPCEVCLPESYARWKLAKGSAMDRRQQLLKRLEKAWGDFKASYGGLSDPELLEPDVTGACEVESTSANVMFDRLAESGCPAPPTAVTVTVPPVAKYSFCPAMPLSPRPRTQMPHVA